MASSSDISPESKSGESKVHAYSREHPHFIRNYVATIAVSAVVGVLLFYFIGGRQLGEENRLSRVSGAISLSEAQLVQAVKWTGAVAYWLGPISGSKYTLVITKKGEAIITYLPDGKGIETADARRLIVQTNINTKSSGPLTSAETEVTNFNDSTALGENYSYDRNSLDHVVVSLAKKGSQVRIYYPTTRSHANIQLDAESLILIS